MRQAPSKRLHAGFDSRHPLKNARVDQRQIAGTTTRMLAGSIPAARTSLSCSSSGLGRPPLQRVTRVRSPYTTRLQCFRSRMDHSPTKAVDEGSSPSGSTMGCDLGSAWIPNPSSKVRFLGGPPRGPGLADGEREKVA